MVDLSRRNFCKAMLRWTTLTGLCSSGVWISRRNANKCADRSYCQHCSRRSHCPKPDARKTRALIANLQK